jgi:hypothetical protein
VGFYQERRFKVNEQNLIPGAHKFTLEEQSRGGKASAVARRERTALKKTLEMLLDMPIQDGKLVEIDKIKSMTALEGKNISVQEAMVMAALQKAMSGDMKAFKTIAEIMTAKTDDGGEDDESGVIIIPEVKVVDDE